MFIRQNGWFDNNITIGGLSNKQRNYLLHGLKMIMDQWPCKAAELADKTSEDAKMLAEIEVMYAVLAPK